MTTRDLSRAVVGVVLAAVCAGCVPKEGVDGAKDAATYSCAAERHLVEQAVEFYIIVKGSPPASESLLVPDYLRTESASMDIDANGNVIAVSGSGCI